MFDVIMLGSMMVEFSPGQSGVSLQDGQSWVRYPSGSMLISAYALSRLGLRPGLISCVGNDVSGEWLVDQLEGMGIDCGQVRQVIGQLTPVALVAVDRYGNKSYAFYRFPGYSDPFALLESGDIQTSYLEQAPYFAFTEASIRDPRSREVALYAAQLARRLGKQISYCVNYRTSAWHVSSEQAAKITHGALAAADMLVLNETEAAWLANGAIPERAVEMLAELGPAIIAITRGSEGVLLYDHGRIMHIPAISVPVIYDVGAGDTFHAGFLAGLSRGMAVPDATRYGIVTAALKISRGAALEHLPEDHEVLTLLEQTAGEKDSG